MMKQVVLVGSDEVVDLIKALNTLKDNLQLDWEIEVKNKNIEIIEQKYSNIFEKYLVLNIDLQPKPGLSSYDGFQVITVGFNKKASVTVSSVEDDETVFCLQRAIDLLDYKIEPQEFVIRGTFFPSLGTLNGIFAFTVILLSQEKEFKNYF